MGKAKANNARILAGNRLLLQHFSLLPFTGAHYGKTPVYLTSVISNLNVADILA